ncbi:protein kinase domain-containing protein, partial [Singulisphaera rosea]
MGGDESTGETRPPSLDSARSPLSHSGAVVNASRRDDLSGLIDDSEALQALQSDLDWRATSERYSVPDQVGRFEIRGELGRGGFGVVYLARDPVAGRFVALKAPRPEVIFTPEMRRRFVREARAAASLDHPNIVPLLEVEETERVVYMVSTYCPGPTLAAWRQAREQPVP